MTRLKPKEKAANPMESLLERSEDFQKYIRANIPAPHHVFRKTHDDLQILYALSTCGFGYINKLYFEKASLYAP